MKTKLFLTGLALTAMVAFSSAQVGTGNGNGYGNGTCDENCVNFVDNDNDGVCDNYAEGLHAEANGLHRGRAWTGKTDTEQVTGQFLRRGQAFRAGQSLPAGQDYGYGQGRGPAAEGRHLYGPGYRVVSE